MSDDTERLVAEIPSELKRLVDADQRTNKEVVKAALWREFGGERKGEIERRIEEKRRRIEVIENERNERENELSEKRQELNALKSKLSDVEESDAALEDGLDDILDTMEDRGEHVWPKATNVQGLATEHGLSPDDVVERLKHRAADQNRGILHTQFQRADMVRGTKGRNIGEVLDDE